MYIACTADARKLMKSAYLEDCTAPQETSRFFSWHAHVWPHPFGKIFFLINDLTGFPVIFLKPKVSQLKNFHKVAEDSIRESFSDLGIKSEHIDRYFEKAGAIKLHGKTSRAITSRITQWKNYFLSRLADFETSPFDANKLTQPLMARQLGFAWSSPDKKTFDEPEILVGKAFSELLGIEEDKLSTVESYVLEIELMLLNNRKVTRTVVLPANATLNQLHCLIEQSFGWKQFYHAHRFYLKQRNSGPYSENQTAFENPLCIAEFTDEELISETTVTIKEALTLPYDLWCEHDLGAGWMHKITLKKATVLPKRIWLILEAMGNCPPDDVGGPAGFEDFLMSINDANNPKREALVKWYQEQTNHRCSFEDINRYLSRGAEL